MRDYSKVSSSLWTGSTGRQLRGHPEAQLVAAYLLTCSHANMIGVFHCPAAYIANDLGLTPQGASKGLRRLAEVGFCTLEEATDLVWVHEMARYQVGERLKVADNQVKSVAKEFDRIPEGLIKRRFFARYRTDFHIEWDGAQLRLAAPEEAPSKPLRSQEQEQEQEQEKEEPPKPPEGVERVNLISVSKSDVDACWALANQVSRGRSSFADLKEALEAAAKRGHPPEKVAIGLAGYFASHDATRDDGKAAKGVHRMVQKDRWMSHLPAEPASVSRVAADPAEQWRKRLSGWKANRFWNTEWGVEPGRPGCLVPPDLLAEFGFTAEVIQLNASKSGEAA